MKKATINTILSLIATIETEEAEQIRQELTAELNRGAEKIQATKQGYADAHDIIIGALSDIPATVGELWDELKDELPEGFTKGKLIYALTHFWGDEIVKVEGKVNSYRKA